MLYKKTVALILLVSLVGWGSIAKCQDLSFTNVRAGDRVPFTGYLFTPEAIVKVYSVCNEDIKKKELECTADITSVNLELQRIKEISSIELASKDKLIEDITKLKNEEVIAREKLLQNVETERFRNKIFIVSSFIGGVLLTGTIFYIAVGLTK